MSSFFSFFISVACSIFSTMFHSKAVNEIIPEYPNNPAVLKDGGITLIYCGLLFALTSVTCNNLWLCNSCFARQIS